MMWKVAWFVVWIIATFIIVDFAFGLITAASTIACLIGVFILLIYAMISVSTKAFTKFTNITFKKNKNEDL